MKNWSICVLAKRDEMYDIFLGYGMQSLWKSKLRGHVGLYYQKN